MGKGIKDSILGATMINYGLAGVLDDYMLGSWASGSYSRRLVRTAPVFVGYHKSERFPKPFKAVWYKRDHRNRVEDKDIMFGLLPNGLVLHNELLSPFSGRGSRLYHHWVKDRSIDLERNFIFGGLNFNVRRIHLEEYNIASKRYYDGGKGFASHLMEHLATSEE